MNKFMELWIALAVMERFKSYIQKLNKMAILLWYHTMVNALDVAPPLELKNGIISPIGIGLGENEAKKVLDKIGKM